MAVTKKDGLPRRPLDDYMSLKPPAPFSMDDKGVIRSGPLVDQASALEEFMALSKPSTVDRCETCRFYIPHLAGSNMGFECHRNAPLGVLQWQAHWPAVTEDDWCGEFEAKKRPEIGK